MALVLILRSLPLLVKGSASQRSQQTQPAVTPCSALTRGLSLQTPGLGPEVPDVCLPVPLVILTPRGGQPLLSGCSDVSCHQPSYSIVLDPPATCPNQCVLARWVGASGACGLSRRQAVLVKGWSRSPADRGLRAAEDQKGWGLGGEDVGAAGSASLPADAVGGVRVRG